MTFGVNLTDNIDPQVAKKLVDALYSVRKMAVRVGLPDSETAEGSPLTLAQIGIINEFGTADGRIPARPFMQRGIEESKDKAAKLLGSLLSKIPDKANIKTKATAVLNKVGAFVAGQIKQGVSEGGFAENAQSTIERKGSSKPLIDTGLLRQSITWIVEDGSK